MKWFDLGQAESNRSLPMEGLRGIAVILVFFVHYSSQLSFAFNLKLPAIAYALQRVGHVGVDLFFILSGYLIYGALIRKPRPLLAYLGRRIQRIYPVFLVIFAIYLVIALLSKNGGGLPIDPDARASLVLSNMLLLPGIFSVKPIVVVAWSLSYEAAFYLVLPLAIGGLRLRAWSPDARSALMLCLVGLMVATGWHHARMAFFLCGMLLVEAAPALRREDGPRLDAVALLAVVISVAALLTDARAAVVTAALLLAGGLLCAAALYQAGPIARTLAWAPLRALGNMSYSYYLVHGLALDVFLRSLRLLAPTLAGLGGAAWWLLLPPAFLATLSASAGLFLLIERPLSILPAGRAAAPLRLRAAE